MSDKLDTGSKPDTPSELDLVVEEVVSEVHLQTGALRPEELEFLKVSQGRGLSRRHLIRPARQECSVCP